MRTSAHLQGHAGSRNIWAVKGNGGGDPIAGSAGHVGLHDLYSQRWTDDLGENNDLVEKRYLKYCEFDGEVEGRERRKLKPIRFS